MLRKGQAIEKNNIKMITSTNDVEGQHYNIPTSYNPVDRFQNQSSSISSDRSGRVQRVTYMFNRPVEERGDINSSTSSSGEDDTKNSKGYIVNVFGQQDAVTVKCYHCHAIRKTRVVYECTCKQWVYGGCLCLTGCLCPCFFIPFVSKSLHNVRHYCASCGTYIGESKG